MRLNNLKGTIIIISLILIIISLSGCDDNGSTERSKSFIGGNDGLDIEFINNAPPDEIFDTEYPFSISLKIENIGEWDINNPQDATVKISGIDPADFGKTQSDLISNVDSELRGNHRDPDGDIIRGTLTNIEFQNLQYQGNIATDVELPIRADICYKYGTQAITKICVLEDMLGAEKRDEKEEVCEPTEIKSIENSGSPIHVSNFKETAISKDKLSFSFTINHIGEGVISRMGTECSNANSDEDRVLINVNTGINGLTCSGIEGGSNLGYTTLYDGEREIVCTQPLPAQRGNYEKQITITLEYDYQDNVDTKITVKPSAR